MHIRSQTPYGSKECVRKRKTGANQHAFLLQNCFHNLDSLERNGVVCRSILFMFLFASLLFAYNVWGEERLSERWMLPRQFACIELPIERIHINSFSIPYFSFSYELWMQKKDANEMIGAVFFFDSGWRWVLFAHSKYSMSHMYLLQWLLHVRIGDPPVCIVLSTSCELWAVSAAHTANSGVSVHVCLRALVPRNSR